MTANTAPRRGAWAVVPAVAIGAWLLRREAARRVRVWDENPDPTGGQPSNVPPGRAVEARELADAGLDVVAIDQRGYGDSERGIDPLEGATTLAADLRVWIDQLALRDVTLVGHSMANVPVVSYSIRHGDEDPPRVRSLVLVGAFSYVPVGMFPALHPRALRVTRWLFGRATLGMLLSRFFFGRRPSGVAVRALRDDITATAASTFAEGGRALGIIGLQARPEQRQRAGRHRRRRHRSSHSGGPERPAPPPPAQLAPACHP